MFQTMVQHFEKFIHVSGQLIMMHIPNVLPVNFIAWQGDKQFDNAINSMKAKAFQFLNSVMQNNKHKLDDNMIKTLSSLIQACVQNLEYVVNEKFSYLQEINKESTNFPDYNYENLIHQILLFLTRTLGRDPFLDQFSTYHKQ